MSEYWGTEREDPAGEPHIELGNEEQELEPIEAGTFAHPHRLLNCQYCGEPTVNTYTCQVCRDGWPTNDCCCENNGDYCEACLAWIEYRREAVQCDYRTTAG